MMQRIKQSAVIVVIVLAMASVHAPMFLIMAAEQDPPLDYYSEIDFGPAVEEPKSCPISQPLPDLKLLVVPKKLVSFGPHYEPFFSGPNDFREIRPEFKQEVFLPKPRPVIPAREDKKEARAKTNDKPITITDYAFRKVTGNGGKLVLEPKTMRMFQQLERAWGEKLTVRWAYRDKKLNRKVGGAGRSMHLQKKALDIVHGGWSKAKMVKFVRLAYKIGFRGFGMGRNVVHIDTRPSLTSWNYGGNRYGLAYRMVR